MYYLLMTYILDLMESQRRIAKNIVDYLNLNNMTPEQLAEKCDSSKQQIYKLMKCETDPRTSFLDRLAKAMSITTSNLVEDGYFEQFEKKILKKKLK